MIPNYDDDVKMAEYGRRSAKYKAIKDARENIRNLAVNIGNSNEQAEIKVFKIALNQHIDDLIEAMAL